MNEFWQSEIGDFTFDEERFATVKDTIDIIHRRGFRIILTVQPFISTQSVNFAEAVREDLLVGPKLHEISNHRVSYYLSFEQKRFYL